MQLEIGKWGHVIPRKWYYAFQRKTMRHWYKKFDTPTGWRCYSRARKRIVSFGRALGYAKSIGLSRMRLYGMRKQLPWLSEAEIHRITTDPEYRKERMPELREKAGYG